MTPVSCWARWSSPHCNTPAMSRADISEPRRRDSWLYVDEFQNFATESFATILSEGAQVSTRLDAGNQNVANQYLAQIDETTVDAVFGNVGSLLAFQVGCRDAADPKTSEETFGRRQWLGRETGHSAVSPVARSGDQVQREGDRAQREGARARRDGRPQRAE